MFPREPVKFYLVAIIFYVAAFSANAVEVLPDAVPLEADKAFMVDHMVSGPNEVVVRWQISENYYLYKEKFIFSSSDFYINDVLMHTDSDAPYKYDWNTFDLEDNDCIIKVISYDESDNSTISSFDENGNLLINKTGTFGTNVQILETPTVSLTPVNITPNGITMTGKKDEHLKARRSCS